MTSAPSHEPSSHGVIAVLQAFMAQLLEMLRGAGCRREIEQRLASYEIQLVLALFGGGLASDPGFAAASPELQHGWRRNMARTLAALRQRRIRRHKRDTVLGRGYRRNPVTMCMIRFERRIASRRVRRFGCARLAFVAATREVRAGAPP